MINRPRVSVTTTNRFKLAELVLAAEQAADPDRVVPAGHLLEPVTADLIDEADATITPRYTVDQVEQELALLTPEQAAQLAAKPEGTYVGAADQYAYQLGFAYRVTVDYYHDNR